jgi:protein-S-isoprenylcysteine O-methyltransferase Ste14
LGGKTLYGSREKSEMNTEEKILHITFSCLYLLFLFERGYFQLKAMLISGEAKKFKESKKKMGAMIVLVVVAQIWVIGSFVYIFKPESMNWTLMPVPLWARGLGMIMAVSGMVLEFSTQIYLGRNYSTTLHIAEEQTMVTAGPYQYMRHPMYTALFTVGIGLGLLSSSWYFLLPFLATMVVVIFRIQKEEDTMIKKFGERYIKYSQETGRFFPLIRKKR